MGNLSHARGCPLKLWQKALAVLLEKEQGNILVDKLRITLLLEGDFNAFNKMFFGHRMIRRAQQDHLLPDECFGSTRNKNPHQLAITRKSLVDLSTASLVTIAIASVGASQCCDRMQHSVASLSCQAWGVPLSIAATLLRAVQAMKICLRAAHGDTDSHVPSSLVTFSQLHVTFTDH